MGGKFEKIVKKRGHRLGGRKRGFGVAGPRHLGVVKPIVRAPGVEHKFYDTFVANATIASTISSALVDPSSTLISSPPQEDSSTTRDGKQITIDTVMIEGIVSLPRLEASALAHGGKILPNYYVALVLDTQTNGADLASENVFVNPGSVITLLSSPLKNLLNATRYTTLKVWEITPQMPTQVNNTTAATITDVGQNIKFSCFLKTNFQVNFNGTTVGEVSAVVDNSLHMIAFTNVSGTLSTINYNARIRFVG